MKKEPQLTRQTMMILSLLMATEHAAGSEIARITGFASGTMYPILIRLEEAGWIKSEWEDREGDEKKPRRRLYSVTGLGVEQARREATAWKPLVERFA